MYIYFRRFVRFVLSLINLGLVRESDLASLRDEKTEFDNLRNKLEFYLETIFENESYKSDLNLSDLMKYSKSENGQDFFALIVSNFSRDKIFLEIGAYNGITFSNTYLLEKKFQWTGLLVECIPRNFSSIKLSRECDAVLGAATNKDVERITVIEQAASNLSGLKNAVSENKWKTLSYQVPGYCLDSLLMMASLKGDIGFLSVDVEGAEYSIFEDANLGKYNISAICIEHNFRPEAEKLRKLITSQGYRTVFEEFSGNDFWFLKV